MSTALAIASVTAVLRDLLNNGLIDHDVSSSVGNVTVSALPPDRIQADGSEKSQLNLFLYQVTPNQGWRNTALPSRDGRGDRLINQPLALDLHYLLTAYGAKDLHGEILLGYGMQLLHEQPVLTRAAVRRSLAPPTQVSGGGGLPTELAELALSKLAEQVELIKIVPQPMTTEEISKLWSAFQAKYRPSAAYLASVVLIESERPTRVALPVGERRLHVVQLRPPVISGVLPQFVKANESVTICGQNLRAHRVKVLFGALETIPEAEKIGDDRIEVAVPPGLRAGINTVRVIHELDFKTPSEPHHGFESNVGVFVLRPTITPTPLNVTGSVVGGHTMKKGMLRITFTPKVGKAQQVVAVLNQVDVPAGEIPRAYTFPAPLSNGITDPQIEETDTIDIPFNNVAEGAYLVRVQVAGAENELGIDGATGRYNAPRVDV
jgi:hypothetical protein